MSTTLTKIPWWRWFVAFFWALSIIASVVFIVSLLRSKDTFQDALWIYISAGVIADSFINVYLFDQSRW